MGKYISVNDQQFYLYTFSSQDMQSLWSVPRIKKPVWLGPKQLVCKTQTTSHKRTLQK